MSPSERDLRAALQPGDDAPVDSAFTDRIVAAGHARQAQRRTRLLSGAAAVVVVAAAATGGALLFGGNDGNGSAGGGRAAADSAGSHSTVAGEPAVGGAQAPSAQREGVAELPACPAQLPRLLLPGGGSAGRFGSTGPLFAKPVASIVLCAYPADGAAADPAQVVLTAGPARALAASLESAAKKPTPTPCPTIMRANERQLAIIATATDGTRLRTVTTKLNGQPCQNQVTNGTAIRYGWRPPAQLVPALAKVAPPDGSDPTSPAGPAPSAGYPSSGAPTSPARPSRGSPPGIMHGSPIHN